MPLNSNPHPFVYRGPVQGVICDWAGTTLDYGSCAPVQAFIALFREAKVEISIDEARTPMGRAKLDHILEILAMPAVAERWAGVYGRASNLQDAQRLYERFLPIQLESLAKYAELIPGTLAMVDFCRSQGIRLGSSTGYSRALMDTLIPLAKQQGYDPDAMVCIDDVPVGRPAPWMQFENAKRLNLYPMAALVTVDDTQVGVEAGRHAGTWSVGVARTGNELGMTEAEVDLLPAAELEAKLAVARQRLFAAGAHYVVDGVGELPTVIEEINARQAEGVGQDQA